MSTRLFLCNIRSAHNVGAIFRTADGAGVEQLYLAGYTPTPIDRFGRIQPTIAKTSLGATESVAWQYVAEDASIDTLQELKRVGYTIVAVEQTPTSVSLYDYVVPERVVYVLGNEIDGVLPDILAIADTVLEIPMAGVKESLNVATAAGVVLFTR